MLSSAKRLRLSLGEHAAGRRCKQTRLFRCYGAKPYVENGPPTPRIHKASLCDILFKPWIMADDGDSSK